MTTLKNIPDDHPQFLIPTSEVARWLWGHMPLNEYQANLDYLLNLGEYMKVGANWIYPHAQISFKLMEKDIDEDGLYWWTVERKPCVDYAANYDGTNFFVLLVNQIDEVAATQRMPSFSIAIDTDSSVFGKTSIICSREFLLAGYNPAFCAHEYCLANNLYKTVVH